jgi:hypothetical protein
MRQRLANGSYLLDQQNRTALKPLPTHSGPVNLEGFGQGPLPPMELPLVYNLVDERTHGNVSIATSTDDNKGLFYLGGPQPLGPSFQPSYRYVLTRIAGIDTQRRVIVRSGPIALEQRIHNLDVTIIGGVAVGAARLDPAGEAWVNKPLQFLVAGGRPGATAWVTLLLKRTVSVKIIGGTRVSSVRNRADRLEICLRAEGVAPIRSAGVQLDFTPQPAPQVRERYAAALPPRGVRLLSMSVSANSCNRPR